MKCVSLAVVVFAAFAGFGLYEAVFGDGERALHELSVAVAALLVHRVTRLEDEVDRLRRRMNDHVDFEGSPEREGHRAA